MEYLRSYLFLPGFVPSVALVLIFYALLRGLRNSMWRIALLSLPGTIAHELAHFVVGALLLAKPRGFSVWPRPHGHTWRLGSVSFGNVGLLNGAFVTLAPLLLLPIAWLCVVHVLLPLWNDGHWGWWLLGGYLTGTALFAALPSFQDIKLGGRSLLLYAAIGGFCGGLTPTHSAIWRLLAARGKGLARRGASTGYGGMKIRAIRRTAAGTCCASGRMAVTANCRDPGLDANANVT